MTGRIAGLMRAVLSADMNLYVMHTNFDRAPGGVNDALAELLSLTDITPMSLGCIGTSTLSTAEISRRLGGAYPPLGRRERYQPARDSCRERF